MRPRLYASSMRSPTSHVRQASVLFLLSAAAIAAGCSPDSGSTDDASLTSGTDSGGNGPTQSGGTLTGGDGDGDGGASGVTVAQSSGTTCPGATTCEEQEAECGDIPDNCGNVLDCGDCGDGESCNDGECVITTCTPLTCEEAGANCGPVSDGCGGLIEDCGTCSQPETCGGGEEPSVCAVPEYCTGLCLQQVDCEDPLVTTTITGIVTAPGRAGGPAPDPLFDALVYVPNGPVEAFQPNVQCSQCGEEASGAPLVSARTNAAGEFTLENVPVGADIPLVIQLGRWRRQVVIPAVGECVNTPAPAELTRLPRNKSEGDIPLIAISTGAVDSLECVLRKIGIDDAEFTQPNGDGRVRLYSGLHAGGQRISNQTPNEGVLLDNAGELNQYDMVLFPCQGGSNAGRANAGNRKQNLIDYTSAGGRIFATHYSYDWLHDNGAFATVGDWDVGNASASDQNGIIDQSFPKGEIFAEWLVNVGASTVLGLMPVVVVRQNIDAVNGDVAQRWMSMSDGETPLHLTFNTPVGAEPEDQCGRALYSDFHVSDDSNGNVTFPNGCTGSADVSQPLTPQEKLVEFMLFDLGSCLTPDIPVCVPKSCEDLELECGPAPDGCNNIIDCGDCENGEICGGGGPGQCGNNNCDPKTCAQQGKECGEISDTCGEVIDCGECDEPGETCGGGGEANICGDDDVPG
jgi:hypothetical protein